MTELKAVLADLTADGDDLYRMVAKLDAPQWTLPTPADGWTIAHQIAHLAATFRVAALAVSDPDAFKALAARVNADFDASVSGALAPYLAQPPDVLIESFRSELTGSIDALAAVPPGQVVPWLVNPLPPTILAAAGMMELFGHGQDIADALKRRRRRTNRLRHIVAFGVKTRDFGYLAHGLTPPEQEFRFELTSPSGRLWEFGPAASRQRIVGTAADFCLLVTRRRHHQDLSLAATGSDAKRWLTIAQAYRGPAGPGRAPGQFPPVKRRQPSTR